VNGRDVVRRLRAFAAGAPEPQGSTIHLQVADASGLVALAFVRMGGESLPWAVGVQRPGQEPRTWAVPDGRRREDVVGMLCELVPVLGAHLHHPSWSGGHVTSDTPADEIPLRQVWLPNGSHVAMLHMLNLRYTFAQAGDPARAAVLRDLGRMCGFLFREAARAGESTIIDATAALREAFTFPADDLRQQHLGFLLAQLETTGDATARFAAAQAAEQQSISTSLDPRLEADMLEERVAAVAAARRASDEPKTRDVRAIKDILEDEVRRRLRLTLRAAETLRADARPMNRGAVELARTSMDQLRRDYVLTEERLLEGEWGIAGPETDRDARTAARRYQLLNGADEAARHALVHGDVELQDDAIAAGDAVRGEIVTVEDRAPSRRSTVPIWTVETTAAAATRLRRGSGVCVAGMSRRTGTIRSVERDGDLRRFVIEITGWKRAPNSTRYPDYAGVAAAADTCWTETVVTLLPSGDGGFGARKAQRVRPADGPGAWLTHGAGPPPRRRRRRRVEDVLQVVDGLRVS